LIGSLNQQPRRAASNKLLFLVAGSLFAQDLARVPAVSREVVDGDTGIRITIPVGEFLISPTEITQSQYEAVIGSNPSFEKSSKHPVENVSWWDAIRYCNLRSSKEKLQPAYDLTTGRCDRTRNGYRLPSDAEWDAALGVADPKQANLGSTDTKDAGALVRMMGAKGTHDVGTYQANQYGVHDMLGNVWEWTDDFANPVASTPLQNVRGLARVIRGGSFISTRTGWSRGFRSSMPAEHKSRFTGFRVVRTVAPAVKPKLDFTVFQQPPAGFESATGNLTALLSSNETTESWKKKRADLLLKWKKILGSPNATPGAPQVREVETIQELNHTSKLMYLKTESDSWEKILVMTPVKPVAERMPVVIVPYYDVDVPAARNLGGRSFMPGSVRAYAYLAAQRGFLAVAVRWFGESYGERYDEAVANLKTRHPQWTGLGKWVWDSQRLLDYIYTLPNVDRSRIGIIGHSLGAKMALYAAAFDERISTTVFSEGGIGFSMSNYEDYWYLGEAMRSLPAGTDQHELLGLIAPRPFLLIGGDEYDGPRSWHYVNAARKVYGLFGKPEQIGYFNHHTGHSPTPDAIGHAMRWLEHFLKP
jgi:hypothetical protein